MTDDQRILGGDYTLKELNIPALTHTIVSGDNPSRLAKRYGLPVSAITRANPNMNFNRLRIGGSLNIPSYYRPAFKLPQYMIDTIVDIESRGKSNAEGDIRNGKAFSEGLTQIREVFGNELKKYEASRQGKPKTYSYILDDVNDRFNTTYKLSDRKDAELAKKITKLWMLQFAEKYYKQHGEYPTEEEMARSWNAGPEWRSNPDRKAKADEYVRKYRESQIRRGYIRQ
jgi:LysM repeat protein